MVFTLKVDKIIDSICHRYLTFYSKNRLIDFEVSHTVDSSSCAR
jgi:ADP-glucose pyrophosphorylase